MGSGAKGSVVCGNVSCGATSSGEWKRGWPLESGGFAHLCFLCGTSYEKLVYCEKFHSEETGWRDCSSCGKKIHCGCIVSRSLYEFLDYRGVQCKSCASSARISLTNGVPKDHGGSREDGSNSNTVFINQTVGDSNDQGRLMQLCDIIKASEGNNLPCFLTPESNGSLGLTKPHDVVHNLGEVSRELPRYDSLLEAALNISLGTPLSFAPPASIEQRKTPSPSFDQHRSCPILPKPPSKPAVTFNLESSKDVIPPMRRARSPVGGRGKSQLLPRYWPRITDQELEQLARDLNSSIVPLFEKVLSHSDAGRIGRLVLPKACAEEYFPPISQSEGVPLKVQDVKGNDWSFQFRYWPNNNSRMYVLEGVTACIQAMQLEAGDTVTFSRTDPGKKLIMGFRKSTNNGDVPVTYSSLPENPPSGNGFSSISQINNGNKDLSLSALPLHPNNLGDGDTVLHKKESDSVRTKEDSQHQPSEKKAKNIGSKSKRLLMHSKEVLELRLTWEEAQDLLRPPNAANPNIITIEGHEFEEYDEPPVFGKRTLFVSRPPGGDQEQWAQCDECSKWRKLPVEVVLPSKWSCSDNDWDSTRGLCSAPEEMSLKALETLLRVGKDSKKRRIENRETAPEREPNGLDALASAAEFGDNLAEGSKRSIGATTTKHPRHRPGCSCIVCIQPPSGKGKHISTCTCNVCMTVKRRFKTVMLRKKKQQSDREGNCKPKGSQSRDVSSRVNPPENEVDVDRVQVETSAGIIDLNSHPTHDEEADMLDSLLPIDIQCYFEKASGESKRDRLD